MAQGGMEIDILPCPFWPVANDDDPLSGYVDCPHGCGEIISTAELSSHLDLHIAEEMAFEDASGGVVSKCESEGEEIDANTDYIHDDIESRFSTKLPKELRNRDNILQPKSSRKGSHRDSKAALGPSEKKKRKSKRGSRDAAGSFLRRLGRSELGPYAHEKQMPSWLRNMLEEGAKVTVSNQIQTDGTLRRVEHVANEMSNLIPVLARLCELDETVEQVFLCHPTVRHVFKMPKEGGFCGYRNIQMLVSHIQDTRADGYEQFPGRLPTILRLQDLIEQAWDLGFNSNAQIETGGIKGTRKYIGTSEAQALFLSLGVKCEAGAFGHSLTIVGFEIRKSGSPNLLVFDPMFKTSPAIERLIGNIRARPQDPRCLIKAYRRGPGYLHKYKEFEILKCIDGNLPLTKISDKLRPNSFILFSFQHRNISRTFLVLLPFLHLTLSSAARTRKTKMRTLPNIIITGTPGVGKTVHCEQLAQDTGLRHLSINQVVKEHNCHEGYDDTFQSYIVDDDKLLDAIEKDVPKGGYLIDWHACDLFPKSWIDLVVVIRCNSTSILYDRLAARGYSELKLQENLDVEIFDVLLQEARESYDEEIVVELTSENDEDIESNCARIEAWIDSWKKARVESSG
ncbi:DUF1671 domain-containing protein [Histoplasma capsulatum G186AR]|uniref:Adenylate kinase isoenzyme 6 homolog n=1 Tax=Ajellomyces capsulatus (strain G186AR / H82 / ATCC MYA-2454 / RMSCC 2432) TaxID=447093 RepID=C0NE83_AJECG|nr:DUF1671 domain-containing protein [Histoplasma capsulatum G186AR]EEH10531.1 DUF1671 domain-containing protein [Histoplasma capsulatum G186AR]